ncbi:MAG: hypothetical protein GX654_00290 [Desulfatiglans sp.]|nr:hypothetical protein [Desulfatiglans sp.]
MWLHPASPYAGRHGGLPYSYTQFYEIHLMPFATIQSFILLPENCF